MYIRTQVYRGLGLMVRPRVPDATLCISPRAATVVEREAALRSRVYFKWWIVYESALAPV